MRITRRESLALLGAATCTAATVQDQWRQIAKEIDGTAGAAALNFRTGESITLRATARFPMASVCKLPIAIAIFNLIDKGKLSRDQMIDIPLYDIFPGVSPIADRYPHQKQFPLDEMVQLMVAKSDNTAVQTLFRLAGGQPGLASCFQQWKVDGMRVDRDERTCTLESVGVRNIPPVAEWTPGMGEALIAKVPAADQLAAFRRFIQDPRDSVTPLSAVQLLTKLHQGELLSKPSTARIIQILESTTTAPGRIKGLLPPGNVVAHKTGTTTTTVGGLNGSTNDAGIVAGRFAIAVFIKSSTASADVRDKIIARISRAAFDHFG